MRRDYRSASGLATPVERVRFPYCNLVRLRRVVVDVSGWLTRTVCLGDLYASGRRVLKNREVLAICSVVFGSTTPLGVVAAPFMPLRREGSWCV